MREGCYTSMGHSFIHWFHKLNNGGAGLGICIGSMNGQFLLELTLLFALETTKMRELFRQKVPEGLSGPSRTLVQVN
jgi:hypothetical protein